MIGNFYEIVITTVLLTTSSISAFVVLPTTTTTTTNSLLRRDAGGVMALNRVTGQSQLDPTVIQKYLDLPMPEDTVLAEYVWVDAVGNTRSKTRTLPSHKVKCIFFVIILIVVCSSW